MANHNKKVCLKVTPGPKTPRISSDNYSSIQKTYDHLPVWQLKILDMNHEQWGWKNLNLQDIQSIFQKLKNYESRTWKEIHSDKHRDHPVPINQLVNKAQKRLEELHLEDAGELYRLRLSGKQRIWGILDGYIFKILWWDPGHTVCPSEKKHT